MKICNFNVYNSGHRLKKDRYSQQQLGQMFKSFYALLEKTRGRENE